MNFPSIQSFTSVVLLIVLFGYFVSWDTDLLIYRDWREWKYMKCLIFWSAVKDMKVEIITILIETGGLFNLEQEYIVGKRKYKKLEIMQPRIKNKSELPVGE